MDRASQLAAQDAQVVGHVVTDDDGAVGKPEKVGEGFLGVAAFAAEQFVADMVDIVRIADAAAGPDVGVEFPGDFAALVQADRGNLNDVVPRRVRAGALYVEDDDIAFFHAVRQQAEGIAEVGRRRR